MITKANLLPGLFILGLLCFLGACEPKGCPLVTKTIEIRPLVVKTLVAEQYPQSGIFCPFGEGPLASAPFTVIVGYSHRVTETFFCDKASDHIYQGAVWFPVRETLKNKFVQKAVLKFSLFEGNVSCLRKICQTEYGTWINDPDNRAAPVIECLTNLTRQGNDYTINVTDMVRYWAQGSVENNGFILVGPKENFKSFSFRGMLKVEECLAKLRDFLLVVTYVEKGP